jgi:hypothetical protein
MILAIFFVTLCLESMFRPGFITEHYGLSASSEESDQYCGSIDLSILKNDHI